MFLQAFRSLNLPRGVERHVSVKQRQRGTNLTVQTFTNTFSGTGLLNTSFGPPVAPTYNQSRQIQFGLRLLF